MKSTEISLNKLHVFNDEILKGTGDLDVQCFGQAQFQSFIAESNSDAESDTGFLLGSMGIVLFGLAIATLWLAYTKPRFAKESARRAAAAAEEALRSQYEQQLQHHVAAQTAALEASRAELQTILDRVLAVILKLRVYPDRTVRYELISQRCEDLFGYTAEEFMDSEEGDGRNSLWRSRIHPDDLENVIDPMFNAVLQTSEVSEQSIEYRFRRKDGTFLWILSKILFAWSNTGQCWNVTVVETDITARKRAELELQESEKRFQTIAQTISQLFFVRSIETGEFIYVSPAYETIWGQTCESLYANPLSWMEPVHPDDRATLNQSLQKQFQFVDDSVTREYRIIRPDGNIRWIFAQVKQVCDSAGNPEYFVGFATDISDRKQVELQLQNAVTETESLLQEIQHRVKNNLQLIISMLNMQQRRVNHPEALEKLRNSNSRIRVISLVHDLLHQSDSQSEVNLARYVSLLVKQVAATHDIAAIDLSFELDLHPVGVSSKVASICGLMLNELLSNVFKYAFPDVVDGDRTESSLDPQRPNSESLPSDDAEPLADAYPPQITVHISESREHEFADSNAFVDPNSSIVELIVADNGIGLPSTFDIETSQSLGLLLVRSFVEQLNGTMTIDTHPGTRFQIRFPNR